VSHLLVCSSLPPLTRRLHHRHHHCRLCLARRRSNQPITGEPPSRDVCRPLRDASPSKRVVVASPPRAVASPSVVILAVASAVLHAVNSIDVRLLRTVCELFDTCELRRRTRRWSAPHSSSSSSLTSTIVALQWRRCVSSSYVS
jgi:hypothetical protein